MEIWEKLELLGEGGYGEVHLASPVGTVCTDVKSSKRIMAVKSADLDDCKAYNSLKAEAQFLSELNGEPNVVGCFGEDTSIEYGGVSYNLLLEYGNRGTLSDLMAKTPHMCEARVANYAKMLLTALSRIHSHGIVHCDLKPLNILVFSTTGTYQLKVCDFGLSRRVSEEEQVRVYRKSRKGYQYRNRGTTLYSSPESVANGKHEICTDVWSLGIIVAEMMTGNQFWDDKKSLYHQILEQPLDLHHRMPPRFSAEALDFLVKCLDRNPLYRWSPKELLGHPFILNKLKGTSSARVNRQIKPENPITGSSEWVSTAHLFTKRKDEEHLQELQHKHPDFACRTTLGISKIHLNMGFCRI